VAAPTVAALRRPRLDVGLIGLYLLAGLPLQWWSSVQAPVPLMNYGPPAWPNAPAYMLAAPFVASLLWRCSPRARPALYIYLTFELLRSLRAAHWLPAVAAVAIVLYMQAPAMRRIYPSMWSRWSRASAGQRPWTRR